jgi:hypothetical protein
VLLGISPRLLSIFFNKDIGKVIPSFSVRHLETYDHYKSSRIYFRKKVDIRYSAIILLHSGLNIAKVQIYYLFMLKTRIIPISYVIVLKYLRYYPYIDK